MFNYGTWILLGSIQLTMFNPRSGVMVRALPPQSVDTGLIPLFSHAESLKSGIRISSSLALCNRSNVQNEI